MNEGYINMRATHIYYFVHVYLPTAVQRFMRTDIETNNVCMILCIVFPNDILEAHRGIFRNQIFERRYKMKVFER